MNRMVPINRRALVRTACGLIKGLAAATLARPVGVLGGPSTEEPDSTSRSVARYPIVDTGQNRCFDNFREISAPQPGEPFFGQDAQFTFHPPAYRDNGDGTISDLVSGLMWQKGYQVLSWEEAYRWADQCRLGGYNDWRVPTIKELYSLVLFSGVDPSGPDMKSVPPRARPFLHTLFDFQWGSNGPRIIDTQLLSSTFRTFEGRLFAYGLNVADGRIKSYPVVQRDGQPKLFTVRLVRANPDYGRNCFVDNRDGTISDLATGLMWEKEDSGRGMPWEEALRWAQEKNRQNHLSYRDWRLPSAKELQSLVDYGRVGSTDRLPAIADVFRCTQIVNEAGQPDYPYYWTSTTHQSTRGGKDAVYLCFGRALGYLGGPGFGPPRPIDIHGPGAQRSDPKTGDPRDYPRGRGPQGDVVRIWNFVRLVRNLSS
jgi:hypothetical protein